MTSTRKHPTSRGRFTAHTLNLITLVLASLLILLSQVSNTRADSSLDGLDLSLGLGSGTNSALTNDDSSAIVNKIMNDDHSDEFNLTSKAIELVKAALEEFATKQRIDPSDPQTSGRSISAWLIQAVGGEEKLTHLKGSFIEKQVIDLDYVFGNFHSRFMPTVQRIVNERPTNIALPDGKPNLSFRCERVEELRELNNLAQNSPILKLLYDIFSNELYEHCLKRKLTFTKLAGVKPSPVVKQLVDIYLDVPLNFARAAMTQAEASNAIAEQIVSGLAAKFSLNEALQKHGPLAQAAGLVLDLNSSPGGDISAVIERFNSDCLQHSAQLASIWLAFDQLALFMSSAQNNLAEFNVQVKAVLPELVYSAVCQQLSQTTHS